MCIDRVGVDGLEAPMQHNRILQAHDLTHIAVTLTDNVAARRQARGL